MDILNVVIMVSPADYKVLRTGGPLASSLNLPYYTAVAWYYKMLPPVLQNKDLLEILPEAENFAINSLMAAIAKGEFIPDSQKQDIAKQMSYYSGLSEKVILQQNLDVPNNFFWKELLGDAPGETIGSLDSRYLGIDKVETGTRSDYSSELTSWLHSFTPAINYFLQNELGYKTILKKLNIWIINVYIF